MNRKFLSLLGLSATVGSLLATPPVDTNMSQRLTWYFNNEGEGGRLLGADANLTGNAYLPPSGNSVTGAGIVVAVIADGIAPAPEFFTVPDPPVYEDGSGLPVPGLLSNWLRPTTNAPSVLISQGVNFNENPSLSGSEVIPFERRIFARRDAETIGTAVSSIIAGNDGDGGPVGVAYNSSILPIRLHARIPSLDQRAQAYLVNLGGPGNFNSAQNPSIYSSAVSGDDGDNRLISLSPLISSAFERGAREGRDGNGAIYVFPAGDGGEINENSNYDSYANSPFTIAVAGFTDQDISPTFSEEGANIVVSGPTGGGASDFVAPAFSIDPRLLSFLIGAGDGIVRPNIPYLPVANDQAIFFTGDGAPRNFSSNAGSTAVVSGVVALMLEARAQQNTVPPLSWRDVQDILIRTARQNDPNDPDWIVNGDGISFNHKYGSGAVDAEAAVGAAENHINLGPRVEQEVLRRFNIPDSNERILVPDDANDQFVAEFDFSNQPNLAVEHVIVETTLLGGRAADLEIVLISPSGTQSVLTQSSDIGQDREIFQFPFMSVRHWGEGSAGTWLLRIRDQITGNQMLVDSVNLKISGSVSPNASLSSLPVLVSDPVIEADVGIPLSAELTVFRTNLNGVQISNLPPELSGFSLQSRFDPVAGFQRYFLEGTPTVPGIYNFTITLTGPGDGVGTMTVVQAFLTVQPFVINLADALEVPGLAAAVGGNQPWVIVGNGRSGLDEDSFDGVDALASAPGLGDRQSSIFSLGSISSEVLTFNWRVSSTSGGDRLYVGSGGEAPSTWLAFIDGEVSYDIVGVNLSDSLSRDISWTYLKDAEGASGSDRGFVDTVQLYDTFENFIDNESSVVERQGLIQQGNMDNFTPFFDSRTIWVPVEDPVTPSERALKASKIGHGQRVSMAYWAPVEADVTELFFSYNIDTQQGADVLEVLVNGVVVFGDHDDSVATPDIPMTLSGNSGGWQDARVLLPANQRNYIQIMYRKDESVDGGEDDVYIDNVRIHAPGTLRPTSRLSFALDEDDDGDGYSNLVEYAFGGDRSKADVPANLPKLLNQGNFLLYEIPMDPNLDGIVYEFQESTDMKNWEKRNLPSIPAFKRNGMDIQQVPIVPVPSDPARYFRVVPRVKN